MKNALLGLFAALVATTAMAGNIDDVNNTVAVDFGTSHLSYGEQPGLDSEHGSVPTVGFSVIKELDDVYLAVDGSRSDGMVSYVGSYDGGLKPLQFSHELRWYDIEGKAGFAIIKTDNFQVTPYASIAYHHWYRPLVDTGVVSPYNEVYSNYTDGLGVIGQYAFAGWVTTLDVGVNDTFDAKNVAAGQAVYDDTRGTTPVVTYYLTGRLGETASVKVSRLFNKHSVFAQLSANRFRYGQSATLSDGSLEPNSQTLITNLTVGFAF